MISTVIHLTLALTWILVGVRAFDKRKYTKSIYAWVFMLICFLASALMVGFWLYYKGHIPEDQRVWWLVHGVMQWAFIRFIHRIERLVDKIQNLYIENTLLKEKLKKSNLKK